MSDDILSVIPSDPYWQPDQPQAERAVSAVAALIPETRDDLELEIEVRRFKTVNVVHCGENLSRITCPHCAAEIDTDWWDELLEERFEDGCDDLTAVLPCCSQHGSLAELDYDWPCGFARFEIDIWNADRSWFSADELNEIGEALGHPVQQVLAHI